jgi:hypothetical protein
MTKRYTGGVVSSSLPTVNAAGASGVFLLSQQSDYQSRNAWPPYKIEESLRFRRSASGYLSRTPAIASDRRTFTWSGWVKLGLLSVARQIFGTTANANQSALVFSADNQLVVFSENASQTLLRTAQLFRDPAAWYHVVWAEDTTQATASNRVKIYVNGVQVTAFEYTQYPSQNFQGTINNNATHYISSYDGSNWLHDGYLAEVNFIDGQQLTSSSFGATDKDGNWSPIAYTGTYGTNGFYLNFRDSTSAATMGYDYSGNGNNWTLNGFNVSTANTTYDIMIDVPEDQSDGTANNRGNYCTINGTTAQPTGWGTTTAFSNGNLTGTIASAGDNGAAYGTIALPRSGKWYWEVTISSSTVPGAVGIAESSMKRPDGTGPLARQLYSGGGTVVSKAYDGTNLTGSYTFFSNATLGVACDMDNGKLFISVGGTYVNSGDPVAGTGAIFTDLLSASPGGGSWLPMSYGYNGHVHNHNYGQRPFAYEPPSGFKTLNTFNLPEPTIKQPNQYFDVNLWTGNATNRAITNAGGFQPDFVWIKHRNSAENHNLYDGIRGPGNRLESNDTAPDFYYSDRLTAFNSNGFNLGTGYNNTNGTTYVGWQWRGSSANATNTSGSITSIVRANPTAGFSIVTYTGTGGSGSIGHGLGVAPTMIMIKSRSSTTNWRVYQANLGITSYLVLNSTAAIATASMWGTPDSNTFIIGGTGYEVNESGATYVAYCFAPVAGYSAFGSYTGNGSTDGPFVYTGFRPRFVIIKQSSSANYWWLKDSARSPTNQANLRISPSNSTAEADDSAYNGADFLSNGFKLRGTDTTTNQSGETYIYMAFAETPFKYARSR